jgi:hypothetical protein
LSLLRRLKKIHWKSYANSKREISEMLPKLEETLGAMYKNWMI